MTEKVYLDTNVLIDAVEGRRNKFGKKVGNPASDLFFQAVSCKYRLIISSWMLEELSGLGRLEQTKMFFGLVKKKITKVAYSPEEKKSAEQRSKQDPDDALHIIIAEREEADYIVTRNVDHFNKIGTKIPVKKPEELL